VKLPDSIQQKIISGNEIAATFTDSFRDKHQLVFTNGCFDILHRGHIHLLNSAKELGDTLVIGLNTDESVRLLKGENRPVKDEVTRAEILASLTVVDFVILFNEETPFELIQQVRPDVLVKGGDYKTEEIVGYDIVSTSGGKVCTVPFLEGFSSSSLIDKIENR
jgi:rfaE bifunctional protein nucleotidyltransferase chain/domain